MLEGYKNHHPGSATGKLHKCFDERGAAAATKLGLKLGLTPETVRVRIYTWSGEEKRAQKVKRTRKRQKKNGRA